MKKHFILSLLICILAWGAIQINAGAVNGFTYNDMLGFLNSIGVVNNVDTEKSDSEISRIEFAVMAAKMLGISETKPPEIDYFNDIKSDHWGKSSVNALVERKIVTGDGERIFRPDDTITAPEACVILLRMINRDFEAEENGGYPWGYINTAARYDILFSSVSNTGLTYKDAVAMIFNTLNVEMEFVEEDDTLLSIYHEIYYGEGQLSAVCGASVNEESICKANQVSINGELFETATEWLYDRLGVFVKYYYTIGSYGDKKIVYVSRDNASKNEVIEITSDCYISYNNGKVEYYTDSEKRKTETEDIFSGVTVVRNGQNMSDSLTDAFAGFYGRMKLIKTKGHNDFDVVVIEDYVNIPVGSIDAQKKIIYNSENPDVSVQLREDDYDIISYVDMEGNECAFEKISVGDVISVAKSKDGTFAKVVIVSNEVSGIIESSGLSEDSLFVVIDGTEYEFESSYYEFKKPSIILSDKVTIKMDLFGRIASYSLHKSEAFKFAYLVNAFTDSEMYGEDRVLIKMYTEDGEMIIAGCGAKVSIDSVKYSNVNEIIKALSLSGEVKSQLIRFKYNLKNEIIEIDTKNEGKDSELSLHLMDAEKNLYRHWTNLVGYNAYVPTSVKVMIVPEEGTEKTASPDQFQMKNITAVPSGKTSRLDLYQIDEDSLTIDFVVYYSNVKSSVDTYASLHVVEKKYNGINSDDESTLIFRLDSNGNGVNYPVSSKYTIAENSYSNIDPSLIDKGDIIRIATDYKNEITSIQLVLDYSVAKEDGDENFFTNALNPGYKAVNNVAVGNFFDGFKMSYGYVARTSGNLIQWGYEKPGSADEIYDVTFDSNKAKILIYDEENLDDPCKLGKVSDIVGYYTSSENYSKLVAVSRSAIISNMVVYK